MEKNGPSPAVPSISPDLRFIATKARFYQKLPQFLLLQQEAEKKIDSGYYTQLHLILALSAELGV
jgi:hypothetical protein